LSRIAIILHEDDHALIEELSGTTETESSTGIIRYIPPRRDWDHLTDSLRACVRAIESYVMEGGGYGEIDYSAFGWMEVGEEGEYGWVGTYG
jgi:hypothetical protein